MKKLFLALTITASTFRVFADETVPSAIAPDPNAPTMEFAIDAIDYGTIKQDADGNRVFTFTNKGTTPIVISEAHGSCGCTVPTYPKEPILPNQKGEIKVHYDTHRVGPFSKSVTVNSNAKNSPVVLKISGTVEAPAITPDPANPTSIIPATTTPAAVTTAPAGATTKAVTPATTTVKKTTTTPVKKTTSTTVKKTTTPVKKTTSTTVKKTTTK